MTTLIHNLGFNPQELQMQPIKRLKHPKISNFISSIEEIKNNKLNTLILWDTDVDGLFAGYICFKSLKPILTENKIHNYINETKVHGITEQLIKYCEENKIEVIIIVDAGTNDIDKLSILNSMGIIVIVIDHHEITENYEHENFLLINSNEMEYGRNVSGAYMVNEVMKYVHEHYLKSTLTEFDELAIMSIVADICERDEYNKNAILNFIGYKCPHNTIINLFRNRYTTNSVSFIISVTSKINAILRLKGPRKLMDMFLNDHYSLTELLSQMNRIKGTNEGILKELINNAIVFEMSNVILLFIKRTDKYKDIIIKNYLGIIATKVSVLKNKLCLVLADKTINYEVTDMDYKFCFSARDPYKRNSLQLALESGIEAKGHESAWGGLLYEGFGEQIELLNMKLGQVEFSKKYDKIIETQDIEHSLTEFKENLVPLAIWNSLQKDENKIGFKFKLKGNIYKINGIKKITYNKLEFISFEKDLQVGQEVCCFPEYNKGLDLVIKNSR